MTEPQQQQLEFNGGLTFTQKISMVAGSVSVLYLLPSGANAAIVHKTTPLTITNTSPDGLANGVGWDVDGNGSNEFTLWVSSGGIMNLANTANALFVYKLPGNALNAQNLPLSFNVGPTLAANYQFGGQSNYRTVLDDQGNFRTTSLGVQGFTKGVDGYLGFKFLISGQTHYGWAKLFAPVNTPSNYSYTITAWAYNDTADAPISVGEISVGDPGGGGTVTTPEPTSSLALLAFGAAGVYRWRKGKGNQGQDEDHNEDIAA